MKKLIYTVCIILTSCTTMQDIRKPEYKTTHELNVGYQEAYRIITTSYLAVCNFRADSIQPVIYTDAGYATITDTGPGHMLWSMDLKEAGQSKTTMEFYSPSAHEQLSAQRIRDNINNKKTGCIWFSNPN